MSLPEVHDAEPAEDLKPVRVRVRQLDYVTKGINPLGDEVDRITTAYGPGNPTIDPAGRIGLDPGSQEYADLASDFQHGQLIMVRPQAYVGLIESGAVRDVKTDEESGEEIIEEEELLDVNTASVEELADWIKTERPTVNDVVQASGGDPDVAQKLLEAESQATDGEPRKGVLEGLSAVISRG
jgi:hypothetical protein